MDSEVNKFQKDDFIKNKDEFPHLNQFFNGYYKRVVAVRDVDYEYAGNQFVYVDVNHSGQGFYAKAIVKL